MFARGHFAHTGLREGRQVVGRKFLTYRLPPSTYDQYWGRMRMFPLNEVRSTLALPVLCVPSRLFDDPNGEADSRRWVMGRVLNTLPFKVLALNSKEAEGGQTISTSPLYAERI